MALTANLYVEPATKSAIWQVNAPDEVQVPNTVPVVSVAVDANADAVYSLIVSPPFDVGAVHVTVAVLPLKVPATFVGLPGATDGVTDSAEVASPYPPKFLAFTVTPYVVPSTRSAPETSAVKVSSSAPVVHILVTTLVPAVAVTVYSVMVSALASGAAHCTVTVLKSSSLIPVVNDTFVGSPGTTVTALETSETSESPALLLAITLNV